MYVFISVHSLRGWALVYAYMCGGRKSTRLSLWFATESFEVMSLSEPGAYQLAILAGLWDPRLHLAFCASPPVPQSLSHAAVPGFQVLMEIWTQLIALSNKRFPISASPWLCFHFLNGKPSVRPVVQSLFLCLRRLKQLQNPFHSRLAFLRNDVNQSLTKLASRSPLTCFFQPRVWSSNAPHPTGPTDTPDASSSVAEQKGGGVETKTTTPSLTRHWTPRLFPLRAKWTQFNRTKGSGKTDHLNTASVSNLQKI